jgi:peroxiredoxin
MNSNTTTTPVQSPSPSSPTTSGRAAWPIWGAVLLSIAVVAAYVAQIAWANLLMVPWYLPVGGTLAAIWAIRAANGRRHWWSIAIALLCVAIASFEWFFVVAGTMLPGYTGPIAEGAAMPPFRAELADGKEFNESFFGQNDMTVLVFFQGRWCPFCMTQLRDLEAHHADLERAGAKVAVVSIEDRQTAAETQKDYPSLTVVADQRRELADAIDLINKGFGPDGGDSAAPTILLVDRNGTVKWLHRPSRFIARPSATELAVLVEARQAH